MPYTSDKPENELTPADWRRRALLALREAELTRDPAKQRYLRELAQDCILKAAEAAQKQA